MGYIFLSLSSIQLLLFLFYQAKNRFNIKKIENFIRLKKVQKVVLAPFFYFVNDNKERLLFMTSDRVRISIKNLYGDKYYSYYEIIFISKKLACAFFLLYFQLILVAFIPRIDICLIQIIIIFLVNLHLNQNQINLYKKKKERLKTDLPNFLTRLSLMVNSGLSLRFSIENICMRTDSDLSNALKEVLADIKNGKSEEKAYNQILIRSDDSMIRKTISAISQNLKNGGDEIYSLMEEINKESLEYMKRDWIIKSQKASQKLLIPNLIIFVGIMLMVMLPVLINVI